MPYQVHCDLNALAHTLRAPETLQNEPLPDKVFYRMYRGLDVRDAAFRRTTIAQVFQHRIAVDVQPCRDDRPVRNGERGIARTGGSCNDSLGPWRQLAVADHDGQRVGALSARRELVHRPDRIGGRSGDQLPVARIGTDVRHSYGGNRRRR